MRGPLGQIASSHSSGTSFVSNPQRCARFPASGNESSDLIFGNLVFSVPQRRARFPGLVSFSFRGPLKSQWALQAFEDTLLGMRGVCAAQGNGVPRKAVPAKRSGKACLCKMGMREGMRTIYICTFVHISARVCARVCASYIYVFSRKLTLQRAWYARGYARYIYIGFRTLFELMARRHIYTGGSGGPGGSPPGGMPK